MNPTSGIVKLGGLPQDVERKQYLLQFFAYDHLPAHLQQVSAPFGEMANHMMNILPDNPERTTMLRKLIEAKDCAVRALIFQ